MPTENSTAASPTAPKPSPQEVFAAVQKTGFLLEQDTARILKEHGFKVRVSRAFQDPDEGKSREVDVWGNRKFFEIEEAGVSFGIEVVAECKNTPGPFVAIGTNGPENTFRLDPAEAVFWAGTSFYYPVEGRPGHHYQGSPWMWLGLGRLPGAMEAESFVGAQLVRMNLQSGTWKADNDQVFASVVVPLAKAMKAFQQPLRHSHNRTGPLNLANDRSHSTVTFPLLVTTANLFMINTDDEPLQALSVPWMKVSRELRSDSLSGMFSIMVVSIAELGNYLTKCVLPFGQAAGELFNRNPRALAVREAFDLS